MRTIFVLVVLSTLACLTLGEGPSADLTLLSAKFQSMVNELGDKAVSTNQYREELASVLQKLQRLQSHSTENRTISLEWFGTKGTISKASPMRIVLVVSSFEGMYLNSGIGTFYSALADFLVGHGHTVTVLYTHIDHSDAAELLFSRWQSNSQKRGINVVRLDPLPVHVSSPVLTQRSYQVYQYMKAHQEEFDVVHFPDWEGPGYFTLLAKHQGLEFLSKVFVVGLHGPTRWVKFANQDPTMTEVSEVETDWLERKSVEMADILVTPSADLPQWLVQQGWNLPQSDNIYMLPFLPGKEVIMINKRDRKIAEGKQKVRELVFFGRLEERKGLVLFADALDVLAKREENEIRLLKITFLGRSTNIDGQSASDYLHARAQQGAWPFRLHFISHKDRKSALNYLLESGQDRLAVMPSLVDNAPYTVYECLYTRIPFLASNLPSISALIHPDSQESALFAPTAAAIAAKIGETALSGSSLSKSSVKVGAVKSWEAFYHEIDTQVHSIPSRVADISDLPKVTVCIPYYNRARLLPMTLQSVRNQDYPAEKIEVVLVDDGSTDPAAIKYVDSLSADFKTRGWKIIHTENKYLGAARNTAASAATGDYLLFLDDDNLGKSNQISTYVSVMKYTHADIVTAAHDVFRGEALPDESLHNSNIASRSVPLGPSATLGMFKNCFGDANFFVNRKGFLESGGFTEERGVGQEDYEYFAKAVLAGKKLEAIPEALLYYRMHSNPNDQMIYNTNPVQNQVRSARPYASLLDEDAETGEVLKVLAHKRVESLTRNARSELVCNMTALRVSNISFPCFSATLLTFTAKSVDCNVKAIYIGSFLCRGLTKNGTSSFTCLAPAIPFPGIYAVAVSFVETDVISRSGILINITKVTTGQNLAVLVANFTADTTLYVLAKLYQGFAQLLGRSASMFTTVEDLTDTPQSKRAASLENHSLRFSLTTQANESATSVAVQLVVLVLRNKDVFSRVGVTFTDFNYLGFCDGSSNCACAPNFAGDDCSSKPSCLNDCNTNGACVDGLFGRVCNCYLGYTGRDCSNLGCPLECSGHGECHLSSGQNGTCKCADGYRGSACESSLPCPGAGDCSGFGRCEGGVCICNKGRNGPTCQGIVNTETDSELAEQQQAAATSMSLSDNDAVTRGLIAAIVIVGVMVVIILAMAVYLARIRRR